MTRKFGLKKLGLELISLALLFYFIAKTNTHIIKVGINYKILMDPSCIATEKKWNQQSNTPLNLKRVYNNSKQGRTPKKKKKKKWWKKEKEKRKRSSHPHSFAIVEYAMYSSRISFFSYIAFGFWWRFVGHQCFVCFDFYMLILFVCRVCMCVSFPSVVYFII